MSHKVRLRVLGLSVSQLQSGAYALVLAEENGPRRIPVVIGEPEAQSIAIVLEGIRTPRPITHDLFVTFAHAFGVRLREVFIYRFEDGIFYSNLTFGDEDGREVVLDARTSDAVAIAIRTDTPIITTEEIVRRTGFILDDNFISRADDTPTADGQDNYNDSDETEHTDTGGYHGTPRLENYTVEELERTLATLIDREEYEEAERVSEILKRKKGTTSGNDTDKPYNP